MFGFYPSVAHTLIWVMMDKEIIMKLTLQPCSKSKQLLTKLFCVVEFAVVFEALLGLPSFIKKRWTKYKMHISIYNVIHFVWVDSK